MGGGGGRKEGKAGAGRPIASEHQQVSGECKRPSYQSQWEKASPFPLPRPGPGPGQVQS